MIMKNRKIINKSQSKPCEICGDKTFLEVHHIRGRNIPNHNHPSNLSDICSNCHTKVHHGIIVIEGRFLTTKGKVLIWHDYKDESLTGDDAKPHLIS